MRSRITWAIVGAVAVIGVFAGLCGEPGATVEPPGFLKDGFAHAETVYAGSEGTPSASTSRSRKSSSARETNSRTWKRGVGLSR
jgi:hypothetical protein